ncbi:hypothetical protein J32TS6_29300 [Virgibacillus pantothenticus]|uniref:Uncharacterized protein n=1 Tax=Virgibacillus pantothenticus TaxID=1473 RepID=A0A0L0QTU7_VIRPA|nr:MULTISPECIES: hypothetical protein [Virgibacillus]API90955.1 hypothetical protein BKP57_03245 [Virgibacillus sp. 6R]KNE22085.1 hypothetical protein AFK71_04620 [Virgibacillus pantothenticus]MBS7428935.1 hypothetical protein [Virgibacillus sp. 19R1-5]MBU8566688.1 hypothetical protein [Virgibacillus pantothenticus]MBU8600271.1 hypothetical protein [Virgibacillus pantothenticus]
MFTKTENFIGMTVAIIMSLVIVTFIASVFIFITYGVVYLLSYLPFVDFHYYSSFWLNVWYFFGFLILNIFMLFLSEMVTFIDRKDKKIRSLDDLGPSNLIEWIKFLIVFVIYMNVFSLISERLEATIIGSTLIAVFTVLIFWFIGKAIDNFVDKK